MKITLGTYKTTPKIQDAVLKVLDSGRLSYGPVTVQYEKEFSAMHNARFGVASNSGTSSLVVALQSLREHGLKEGSEVIVPALTFVASVNAILHNGLVPVLVDVDPVTFNIDIHGIKRKITPKTKAIMPVHLFGQMANMLGVWEASQQHDLFIIEDSCESVLASHTGFGIGELSHISCFSTYMAHHLTTGVGGMAITNMDHLATKMRSLVNHGISLSEIPVGVEYDPQFLGRNFRFTDIGHSFRITELEAAIGLEQLKTLPDAIGWRRRNAYYLKNRLAPLKEYMQFQEERHPSVCSSWMVFPIVLKNRSKWPLMHYLRENGIECREMVPLTNQPCYRGMWNESDYPVAQRINESGLYIPVHQELNPEHLDYMISVITSFFERETDEQKSLIGSSYIFEKEYDPQF